MRAPHAFVSPGWFFRPRAARIGRKYQDQLADLMVSVGALAPASFRSRRDLTRISHFGTRRGYNKGCAMHSCLEHVSGVLLELVVQNYGALCLLQTACSSGLHAWWRSLAPMHEL